MLISNASIRNRTTVGVLMFLIVVAGAFSYATLPRESAPDVEIPIVIITTVYEGVSPEDVETAVTIKIENELTGLKGVKDIESSSAEGLSTIVVEFMPDVNIDDAMQYVRDKVDQAKPELPDAAEEPFLKEVNVAEMPIMMVNITGPISLVRLKAIADRLEEAIEQKIDGVLNVDVLGGLEREIRLEMDQDKVAAYGLTFAELLKLIPAENVNISAGGLETEGVRFNVRVPAEFAEPEDADGLLLAVRDGKPIYLLDVARVVDTFKDRESYARLNGKSSITLSIQKRIGADIIPIAAGVEAILDRARAAAPQGVDFKITHDRSDEIRMMVSDLENNIFSGLVLVVIVLVLFMGWRSSVIVALAIPMSMLISFAVIQAFGMTLNMVVLFSLILALGMLVDNAIVIVENIYRHVEMGYDRLHAAMKGTAEVAWPVITSTATTIAAFAPLLMWPGIMGDFMRYLPMTLIITLSSSLFVAMVITPTICSLAVGGGKKRKAAGEGLLVRVYRRFLGVTLGHRLATVALSALLLVAMGILFAKYNRGKELFPEIDPRNGLVNIRFPQGTNIRRSNEMAALIEKRTAESIQADLKYTVANVGSGGGGDPFSGGASGEPHVANLTLTFHDYEDRARPSAKAIDDLRGVLTDLAGAEIKVDKPQEGPPVGAPITVRVIGEDFDVLRRLSDKVKRAVARDRRVVNVRSDFEAARPELAFKVDRRQAALLGVNTAAIGNFLKTAIFGREVGTYRQFNDEYDITIRLPLSQRANIEDILRLRVPNANGQAVPLSSLGTFSYTGGLGTIRRLDQKRVITITADNAEGTNADAVRNDVQADLASIDLPDGYELQFAGEKEELDKAAAFLGKAYVIAVLIIVMILVAQFNTLSAPLIIMTTVLLSLIGVLAGLLICEMPFGVVMTGVGVISLAGVVVNNAIVLLDYTRQLQRRGLDLVDATVRAGVTRLRPVLLTAATTILGLIPMATGVSFNVHTMSIVWRSESSQWWASMAVAVIFGLAFATLLTLVVVPSLYVSLYRLGAWFGLGGLRRPDEQAKPAVELEDF